MVCHGHWVLRLVISHTREEVRVVFVRALGFGSCDFTHETGDSFGYGHGVLRLVMSRTTHGGTISYVHWFMHLVISQTRQGIRFVAGIGFCVL